MGGKSSARFSRLNEMVYCLLTFYDGEPTEAAAHTFLCALILLLMENGSPRYCSSFDLQVFLGFWSEFPFAERITDTGTGREICNCVFVISSLLYRTFTMNE
jgi:hypothetical protein